MSELPIELLYEILHNLNDKSLKNACKTDTRAAQVCEDDLFWYERIKRTFNYDLKKYKDSNVTYRDMYNLLIKYKERESDLLIYAAQLGYLPLVKYLIEESNITNIETDIIYHALTSAAEEGQIAVVKYLITETKANIDEAALDGALDGAASFGHLGVVKYLIQNGANIDSHLFSNVAYAGEVDIFDFLSTQELPTVDTINDALISAIRNMGSNLLMVKYLVEKRGATDLTFALFEAAENGHLDIIQYLVEEQGVDIHSGNDAEDFGYDDIIKYIEELP